MQMIPIALEEGTPTPLYAQIYARIKGAVLTGELATGAKLPSKRKLAAHLQVSMHTVENAYEQLLAEGYIAAREKSGYFVNSVEKLTTGQEARRFSVAAEPPQEGDGCAFDMKTHAIDTASFPVSVWNRLMRECLGDGTLLQPTHPQGDPLLRAEIAAYLRSFRNMEVDPAQIVLGAGTEYLLGLITELLSTHVFALENPGYYKHARIMQSRRVLHLMIALDEQGMREDLLSHSAASAALVTPSRHFPCCTVMGINRRMQLLNWAVGKEERYLIEDDFDSEYRYQLRQIPPLYSLDKHEKVIYTNTFARTLTPALRIGYMVLPPRLLELYRSSLLFYSSTVSRFEQGTLASFLQQGYYERHINRMRLIYKRRRDALLSALAPLRGRIEIIGKEAGLHLLLRSAAGARESALVQSAAQEGVRVYGLSDYYFDTPVETNAVVAGFGGFDEAQLEDVGARLVRAWAGLGGKDGFTLY